jgi:Fur family ferric uptake transcriptional regulator
MVRGQDTIEAKKMLRRAGKRVTPQRVLILETLQEAGGHLDADRIYSLVKRKMPRLSLSTVYRTLTILKEEGLIEELHLGEEHHHYEIKGNGHHHLICRGCGKVIEFEWPFSERLIQDLGEEYDFEITGMHLDLMGYCDRCRKKAMESKECVE